MPRTDAGAAAAAASPGPYRDGGPARSRLPRFPLVVEIRGEIDIQSAPGLRDELPRVIRRCGPELALDLAGVTFMDGAGLNVLLATRRRLGHLF